MKLVELVNLRYGLDLLESNKDVHQVLGGQEQKFVKDTLQSLNKNKNTLDPASYEEKPSLWYDFVVKQAVDEYTTDPQVLATAKNAADKMRDVPSMTSDEKSTLIKVFEKYQTKFTDLEKGITEAKLKSYLTDNYDTLKNLQITGFPNSADKNAYTADINKKSKDDLITLAVAAREVLDNQIYNLVDAETFTPNDKKEFLKKYISTDFSNSEKSIEFIQKLNDKDLLLLNKYSKGNSQSFMSRDFLIRELSQHKLSLEGTLGLTGLNILDPSEGFVLQYDYDNLRNKFKQADAASMENKKDFINNLSPEEFTILSSISSSGFVSKQGFLKVLDDQGNASKTLTAIFGFEEKYFDSKTWMTTP